MKIIGIGDSVIDAYLHQKKLYPGGNSVNVPVLAKRFGAEQAAYIGVLGNDAPGRHFLKALHSEGVDSSHVRVVEGITAQNLIQLDESGDRHFVGNNGREVAQYRVRLALTAQDIHYIENYTLAHTSVHSFIDDLLPAIARRTDISMDFSDGYNLQNIAKLCPLLRFAFFSGGSKSEQEVHDLAAYALECGARTVVVTRGIKGSYLLESGRSHTQSSVKTQVVDALGAGDSFIAAFLTYYMDNKGDMGSAALAASKYAAKCCGHYGAFGNAMELPLI
ncbi:PfkB family carbohydrate kinase [Oscillospiraceae bacterium PP1C4]